MKKIYNNLKIYFNLYCAGFVAFLLVGGYVYFMFKTL